MGLIKAVRTASGGVWADQWREYFYCEAIPADILAVRGQKRTSTQSANTKGGDNIISNGSIIAVADGQCMLIVEQGKVVEVCAEPGEFTFDASSEPSVFAGHLGSSILGTFRNIGKRFTFGGDAPKDQRVYYFNTKEIIGNKYGTASPVPFRVVDPRAGIDLDIAIRCFGEYSYRIVDPLLFYANVCGNMAESYSRREIDGQLKSELLTALQPAFARISGLGIRYSELPGHTLELSQALKEILSSQWRDHRGIEIGTVGVSSVKAGEEDEKTIQEMQREATYTDPTRAASTLVRAQSEAMKAAASNTAAGPAMAFMGMHMAGQAGGANPQDLYAMGRQEPSQPATAPTPDETWTCACGQTGCIGKFCHNCGQPKPQPKPAPSGTWQCACGATAIGNFCTHCGAPRPAEDDRWTCACGTVNRGKFCTECGRPRQAPKPRCKNCGWEPEDPANPPKFCPECGTPFQR